jgi:hypothetical protein
MRKFVLSDIAPEGHKRFSLGADEVEAPFETSDPVLAANAASHPWLKEETSAEAAEAPPSYVNHLKPEDDVLSAVNSIANDPDEVKKALEAREDVLVQRTAIDADLDQDKKVETKDGVAETVAAADAAEPKPTRKLKATTGPTASTGGKE